jgi:hypothetical protein
VDFMEDYWSVWTVRTRVESNKSKFHYHHICLDEQRKSTDFNNYIDMNN